MTKLRDIMELLRGSDKIIVKKGKNVAYAGFKGLLGTEKTDLKEEDFDAEVKKFQSIPEIRHKEYKKRGLLEPIRPDIAPTFNFHDLQMTMYYEITI